MTEEELRQQIKDEEHLKLLSLGYMVSAGVTAFGALFGMIYVFMGAMLVLVPSSPHRGEAPPAFLGWIFGGIGLVFVLVGLTLAALKWRTAVCLKQRRALVFCQVIAAVSCLALPYGTILGVLTFIVVGRPSVRQLFLEEASNLVPSEDTECKCSSCGVIVEVDCKFCPNCGERFDDEA